MKRNFFTLAILVLAIFMACEKENIKPTVLTTSDYSIVLKDNGSVGDTVGIVPGTSNKGTIKYNIVSQNPNGVFIIGETYGELIIANADLIDSETNPTMALEVAVSKDDITKTSNVTIEVIPCVSVDLSSFEGILNLDEDGIDTVEGAGVIGDCGELTINTTDFIGFECIEEAIVTLQFIPSEANEKQGAVIIENQDYICDVNFSGTLEGEGTYDLDTKTITINYAYDGDGFVENGIKTITPSSGGGNDDDDDVDKDGDGVPDSIDDKPNNPCLPKQDAGYTGFDSDSPKWGRVDCDGDGIINSDEVMNGTDPYDSDNDDDDNDDECENTVQTSIWNGDLDLEEEFEGETFTSTASATASCGELILMGDLVDYGCDNIPNITVTFTPAADGATNGTVTATKQDYDCLEGVSISYEATGTYDELSETIILNYTVIESGFEDFPLTGTQTVTPQ